MPDMTCEEFRSYLIDKNALGETAASIHAQHCAECRSLSVAQEELIRCLRAVRENAPKASDSLDAAVMTAYRREKGSRVSARPTLNRSFVLAPIAAVLLVASVLWLMRGYRAPMGNSTSAHIDPPVVQASTQTKPVITSNVPKKPRVDRVRAPRHAASERPERPVAATEETPVASGFRDLMYCDPISCGGAMQVVRIQIPEFPNEPLSPHAGRGPVQADVVIGPDGIARAIRFVKY